MVVLYKSGMLLLLSLTLLYAQSEDVLDEKLKFNTMLKSHPDVPELRFDAGYEAYLNGDLNQAQSQFKSSAEMGYQALQFPALYNLGNTLYSQAEQPGNSNTGTPPENSTSYTDAVNAFRQALQLNASDENAKYNYELALKKMLAQPPQQQNQKQDQSKENSEEQENKDQKQKESNNKSEQPQQSPEQDKSHEEHSQEQENSSQEIEKSDQKPDSESILDALRAQEKLQPRLFIDKMKIRKPEKDW